jgi:hypothetical protein
LPPDSGSSSKIRSGNFGPKIENPPASAISGGGYIGDGSLFSALAQPFPHARMRMCTADSGAKHILTVMRANDFMARI